MNETIARTGGFIEQEVIPPSPPVQTDWVIIQRFASQAAASEWLRSDDRTRLVEQVQPWLVGRDDVHLFEDDEAARTPAPVSAIISTSVEPGDEAAFKAWQARIAPVQLRFAGFQGYKLQPPDPGIHDEWVTVLRFDSQRHLDAWLSSPERQKLIAEAETLTGETRTRTVKTGFDGWFALDQGAATPPGWKQNMMVLLVLYPVVFLFGKWVQQPVFTDLLGMPFWLSLFCANVASVVILSLVVPRVRARFAWWLDGDTRPIDIRGAALMAGLYGLFLVAFWQYA